VGGTLIFSTHNPRSLVIGWHWDWESLRAMARRVSAGRRFLFGLALAALTCAKLALALFRASVESLPRALRRIKTRTFWSGDGYLFDPSHGGLWTHCAVPDRVTAELGKLRFAFLQILPEDHPQ
jgi:hypothetical protein